MNCSYAKLRRKPVEELEFLAMGEGTDEECVVQGAQLILRELQAYNHWRDSIGGPTDERLRRWEFVEACKAIAKEEMRK